MDEELRRSISAQLSAQQFFIEILVSQHLRRCGEIDRAEFIANALRVGSKTGHGDEEDEALADIAAQLQRRIEAILARAIERSEDQ